MKCSPESSGASDGTLSGKLGKKLRNEGDPMDANEGRSETSTISPQVPSDTGGELDSSTPSPAAVPAPSSPPLPLQVLSSFSLSVQVPAGNS